MKTVLFLWPYSVNDKWHVSNAKSGPTKQESLQTLSECSGRVGVNLILWSKQVCEIFNKIFEDSDGAEVMSAGSAFGRLQLGARDWKCRSISCSETEGRTDGSHDLLSEWTSLNTWFINVIFRFLCHSKLFTYEYTAAFVLSFLCLQFFLLYCLWH